MPRQAVKPSGGASGPFPARQESAPILADRTYVRYNPSVAEQVVEAPELPLERLEAEICEGAAHLAAGMARWLLLVGEFDRRKGHERWECRTAAAWLNWHCGISMRTAQDQVRVGRALLEFPAIAQAFCRGELSYSKVRAITRVVTPATEGQLLELAPFVTASQMERIVA